MLLSRVGALATFSSRVCTYRDEHRLSDLQGWSDQTRLRAVVGQPGDWVAITGDEGVRERLIDRRELLKQMGSRALPPT
jgi:hypothetical protein